MSRNIITRDDVARMPDRARRQVHRQLNEQASVALAKIKCRRCGDTGRIVTEDGGALCPACHRGRSSPTVGGSPIVSSGGERRRPWSAAQPTVVDGIRFPSRMEARVYERLKRELLPGETLYRQYPIALTNLAPGPHGQVLRFTCDFMVQGEGPGGQYQHFVEAKGRRRSADYPVRKAAAEKLVGTIQEVDR